MVCTQRNPLWSRWDNRRSTYRGTPVHSGIPHSVLCAVRANTNENTNTNTNTNTYTNTNTNTGTTSAARTEALQCIAGYRTQFSVQIQTQIQIQKITNTGTMHLDTAKYRTLFSVLWEHIFYAAFIPGDLTWGVPLGFCHAHFHLASRYFTNIGFKGFSKSFWYTSQKFHPSEVIWLEEQKVCRKPSMYVCSQPFTRGAMFMKFTNLGQTCWKCIQITYENITGFPHRWSKRSWSVRIGSSNARSCFLLASSLLHHLRTFSPIHPHFCLRDAIHIKALSSCSLLHQLRLRDMKMDPNLFSFPAV